MRKNGKVIEKTEKQYTGSDSKQEKRGVTNGDNGIITKAGER